MAGWAGDGVGGREETGWPDIEEGGWIRVEMAGLANEEDGE